jgi:hypothetical protein
MHTSLIMVALLGTGELSETQATPALKWQDSYNTARQMGRQQRKPLAVFIGNGSTGWKKVAQEGKLSEKAKQLLAKSYICLYVDRTQPGGERLAETFEVPSGPALVLSSRDGNSQVFFHTGKLTAQDVETRLAKYTGAATITRTEMLVDPRISYAYDPAPATQQYASPSFGNSGFGGFGGFGGGGSGGGSC